MSGVLRLRKNRRFHHAALCGRWLHPRNFCQVKTNNNGATAQQRPAAGQKFEATNGLEMKCFNNKDGLMWIAAATERHPNQRRGAN
jgi:hypothetical protein